METQTLQRNARTLGYIPVITVDNFLTAMNVGYRTNYSRSSRNSLMMTTPLPPPLHTIQFPTTRIYCRINL